MRRSKTKSFSKCKTIEMKRKLEDVSYSKISSWQCSLINLIETNQLLENGEQIYNVASNENHPKFLRKYLSPIFASHSNCEPISKIKNDFHILARNQKLYQRKDLIYYCTIESPFFLIDYIWLFHINDLMLLRSAVFLPFHLSRLFTLLLAL